MIYCVRFADVEAHLEEFGYTFVEAGPLTRLYARGDDEFTIRLPNVNGDLPEIVVDDAFQQAGLTVPRWDVHWCD